jgi:two-component system OmpR family sensor kinase
MRSLRVQVLVGLLALYLTAAAAAMLLSYRQYATSINAFMDGQLRTLARDAVTHLESAAVAPPSPTVDEIQHSGKPVLQVWSEDGRLLRQSYPLPGLVLQREEGFHSATADGSSWRVDTVRTSPFVLQVVQSNDFRNRVILDSAWKSAAPVILLIPLSALVLWLVVRRVWQPVDRLVGIVSTRSEHELDPLPTRGVPTELTPFVESINTLLRRLEQAFESQRNFAQDAAHALRTPLAACQLRAEWLRNYAPADLQAHVAPLSDALARMQRLVEQLLRLAREDAELSAEAVEVDLVEVIKDAIGALVPLADLRGVDLGVTDLVEARTHIDADALRCVLDNLLDNAVRYTSSGRRVDVALERSSAAFVIRISDEGPGIPPESIERVFDRFYRVSESHVPGSGLGLAIVRAAADRAGITVTLDNRRDRSGIKASIHLQAPLSPG